MKKIADGRKDAYIRQFARDAKAWGKPVYISFAHEQNAPYYEWAIGKNGNTHYDYIRAWRRVVSLFRSEGATNVRFVGCPATTAAITTGFKASYPGDSYVDWTALDGYNYGTVYTPSGWTSFTNRFSNAYNEITGFAPTKPMMIAETSSVEVGGDKAA